MFSVTPDLDPNAKVLVACAKMERIRNYLEGALMSISFLRLVRGN